MTRCYLGLGSNLRSPERQLRQALCKLRNLPQTMITQVSSFYFSKPLSVSFQPPYCNIVIAINTSLSASELLSHCQRIEKMHQRVRTIRWGARTLDIDLLLYGNLVIKTIDLIVPHPRMIERDFVLVPLLEIAPLITLPTGKPVANYINHCKTNLFKNKR